MAQPDSFFNSPATSKQQQHTIFVSLSDPLPQVWFLSKCESIYLSEIIGCKICTDQGIREKFWSHRQLKKKYKGQFQLNATNVLTKYKAINKTLANLFSLNGQKQMKQNADCMNKNKLSSLTNLSRKETDFCSKICEYLFWLEESCLFLVEEVKKLLF